MRTAEKGNGTEQAKIKSSDRSCEKIRRETEREEPGEISLLYLLELCNDVLTECTREAGTSETGHFSQALFPPH